MRQTLVVGRPGSTAAIYRPCWRQRKSGCNAENLSETVPASPRASPVSRRVNLGPRDRPPPSIYVRSPGGVGAGFSPVVGVYSLGKIAMLRLGVSGARGTQGHQRWLTMLYLPQEWTGDGYRCRSGGGAVAPRGYRSPYRRSWNRRLSEAQARGVPQGPVSGRRFSLRDVSRVAGGTGGNGNAVPFLDVRPDMTVWLWNLTWTDPPYQGNGRPRKPRPRREERQALPAADRDRLGRAWRPSTGTAARVYRFSGQRVRVTRRRKPGEVLVYRHEPGRSEPRYYRSNAPPDHQSFYVGGSRWRH